MTDRFTLQDALREMGWPGNRDHVSACCKRSMPSWAMVETTPEEAERLGLRFACGNCLALPPEPAAIDHAEERCREVDRERGRRMAADFEYDFGSTPALNDLGTEIEAGVRSLQMRAHDISNWQSLYSVASVMVLSGQGSTVLPMRAEDNWNIQTPASQVLQALTAVFARGSALVAAGGAIKTAIRAAADPYAIDIMEGWP